MQLLIDGCEKGDKKHHVLGKPAYGKGKKAKYSYLCCPNYRKDLEKQVNIAIRVRSLFGLDKTKRKWYFN